MHVAAITDEFSPDLEVALDAMRHAGLAGAELRVIGGRNIIEFSDDEARAVRDAVEARGMAVVAIASPLLKCVLPGGPAVDPRTQQDVFGSPYTAADQPRLAERAFALARCTGAALVRVFSYWRTIAPDDCHDGVAAALGTLAEQAQAHGVVIGLENEHACNIGTGEEAARLLARLHHPALRIVWDPANALVLGERPYPDGYAHLPTARIGHVHAKDCTVREGVPTWRAFGEGAVDWRGQLAALRRDRFDGWISLETHWSGPHGDKLEASAICARAVTAMVSDRH